MQLQTQQQTLSAETAGGGTFTAQLISSPKNACCLSLFPCLWGFPFEPH